ncbi:MAG: siphovirus ReqiPepy6 Gp37-like family protein, partial [Bacteroides sp.]|nr:siphovirus ReqiPepy6 Gp37-like family protein [Bacteroides sp.]
MHASLYKPISASAPTWAETKITDIFKIISYNYTKKFYEIGSFSMTIPVNEPAAELLEINTFLATSDGDHLFVTDIKETESRIVLEGHDLKYLLAGRVTLFPTEEQDKGTYGYFVTKGSTGECIGSIVRHNISEASDPNRRIYGFSVSDAPFGLPNDTYMTRLEPLDKAVETLCKNAGIGYDVTMEIGSAFGDSIQFKVIQPTDRSAEQTDIPRVIFSKGFLNVENLSKETGVDAEKNAIYAINGSDIDNAVVKLVNRNGEGNADYGVYRRETTVNVNCGTDEIDSYALKAAEDFITTDSFAMEVTAAESYKRDWFVGDIVTFRHKGISRSVPITAAEIQRTADKFTVRLTAGEAAARPVSTVNRRANKAADEITQTRFDDGYVTVVKELPETGKKNKIYVLEETEEAEKASKAAENTADTICGFVFDEGQWKKIAGGNEAVGGVGEFTNEGKNSEIFNSYKDGDG